MKNTMIIFLSVLILSGLTESKPRRMGPRPAYNFKTNENDDYSDQDGEIITRNLPYPRPLSGVEQSNGGNNFDDYGSGGSGRTTNPRPAAHRSNKVPYNDFETNYNDRRYGFGSWRKFVRSSEESSEDDSFESCIDCSHISIGNGYKNHNIIHYNSHPNTKENKGETEMYQEFDEQSENESQLVTRNGYRATSKQGYNSFGGNNSQGRYGSNNNQRRFRPQVNQIHENSRPYNNYETNNNRKRPSETGNFGNGHDNTNTFNIHKKNTYIR